MRAEARHQLKQDRFSRATMHAAEQTMHWTVEHQGKLIIAGVVVALVIAAVIGGWYYNERQDEKASADFGKALQTFDTPVRPAGMPAQPDSPSFASAKERATEAHKKFQDLATQYPHTHVADFSRYFMGVTSAQLGDNAAAERELKTVADYHNRDLSALVKEGSFREDLFYRVSVIPMELPPLRERGSDIAELTEHFVEKYCTMTGRKLSISGPALRLLENYFWPGNVRELEHTIERAVALEKTDTIQPERLPEQVVKYSPTRVASELELPVDGINLTAHLDQLEKTYVLEALRRTDWNQTNAAELLKMSVRSLRHLLDKHDLRERTAQMRDERRTGDSIPRRRANDPHPRRRDEDTEDQPNSSGHAASAGER